MFGFMGPKYKQPYSIKLPLITNEAHYEREIEAEHSRQKFQAKRSFKDMRRHLDSVSCDLEIAVS